MLQVGKWQNRSEFSAVPDFGYVYEMIKRGEGQHLDFKLRIKSPSKISRTLVAFANSEGGRLLVGVSDGGEIIGIDEAQEKHVLIKAAREFCDPAIFLHFRSLRARGKQLLEVEVKANRDRNVQHSSLDPAGRWLPFVRVGDESALAPGFEELNQADQFNLDPIPILMDQHADLVGYIEDNGSITIKEYMQLMHIPYKTAQRSLQELEVHGVLVSDDIGGRVHYSLGEEP